MSAEATKELPQTAVVEEFEKKEADDAAAAVQAAADDPLAKLDPNNLPTDPAELDKLLASVDGLISETKAAPAKPAPVADAPVAETLPADPAKPIMVPKQRLDEVLTRARELEEENIFLKGRDSVLAPATKKNEAPAPEVQIAAVDYQAMGVKQKLESSLDQLAADFDEGKVKTMAEFRKQEKTLKAEAGTTLRTLKEQRDGIVERYTQPDPEQVNARITTDPWLADATTKLKAENAWTNHVSEKLVQLAGAQARQELNLENAAPNAQDLYRIRAHAVAVLESWGLKPAAAATPPAAGLSPEAQRRVEQTQAKLELQKKVPPEIHLAGEGASKDTAILNGMTPDQVMGHSAMDLSKLDKDKLDEIYFAFDRARK